MSDERTLLTVLKEYDCTYHKPVKNTIVISQSRLKKEFNIDLEKLGTLINLPINYLEIKQHKCNGVNIGLGLEISYDSPAFDCLLHPLDCLTEYRSERNSKEYQQWRVRVLSRDKHCKCCGYDDPRYFHAHHIFGFEKYPELRYNEDNGITLCKWCHEKYHSLYGKKNPNPVTFGEYMNKYGVV